MAAAARHELDVLTELTFGNALHDHDPAKPQTAYAPCTDEGRDAFAHYADALLGHYGEQISTVEVWNEYNGTWCAGPASGNRPMFYSRMLQTAYREIKSQHPGVRVLGGAAVLAPLPWFEDLFKEGALDSLDGIVIHPYVDVPERAGTEVAAIRALAARYEHGGSAKPIWVTECGSGDNAHPGRQDMARYLVRLLTVLRGEGVERIYWYLMRDYSGFTTGLLRSEHDPLGRYTPTAAYPAYANLIRQLSAARFVRRETTDRRTRMYLFDRDDAEVRVAWSTAGSSQLRLTTDRPLRVIDLMGVTRTLKPADGQVVLTVEQTPVYLLGSVGGIQESRPDQLVADSAEDFSGEQGEVPGSWSYGYYEERGGDYQPDNVKPMKWVRDAWDYHWQAPTGETKISTGSAHPGGRDFPVWSVRRWHSSVAGPVHVAGSVHRSGQGDGTGIQVFVNHDQFLSRTVGGPRAPETLELDLNLDVKPGATVDFVATPGPGTNVDFDAVGFSVQVTTSANTGHK